MSTKARQIKKGDDVEIIAGNNKGQKGKIIRSFPKTNLVVIEGVNVRERKTRSSGAEGKPVRIAQACPIHRSNIKKVIS